ncbi:DNA alkylation repair enzyme [Chryseobacterium sp. MOF25P]|uniref:DNA alkylation repair protein n=1 Tax=unclassified Chryseobacterium TaxID=2593645 RepID=UPI0008058676|nr:MULTISPECIES: DNA alkylation repair protein [unclassified Chryseobacterium]OBW41891.1 DNA alkylation repair enzyme [Chryseobacterium sp. MOF25P]OBW45102.1 DNA alkylation repair enzyme [Chryseobacterium sp. BGARF1]
MKEIKRKGSRSAKDIPQEILDQLNCGEIETANLVEWLAVDQRLLLENLLKQFDRTQYLQPLLAEIENLKKQTVNTINEAIGTGLFEQSLKHNDKEILTIITNHSSDLIRCWATYTIGKNQALNITQKLEQIQRFSADKHFGVREICWLAIRSNISKDLAKSIEILSGWINHTDENIRRFASEATRPRGVWCEHIEELKQNPELGLAILEPMKSDTSKYVQDSVGNWLNDASKTQPEFVKSLCEQWKNGSPTKETAYIIKKALRTIEK